MKLSRWLILLLALLSAGLLVGAGLAIPNAGSQVTIERKVLAGDPEAADGVELTLPLTCGSQIFWVTTFPAGRPEEAETVFSTTLSRHTYSPPQENTPISVEISSYYGWDSAWGTLEEQVWNDTPPGEERSYTFVLTDYFDAWPLNIRSSADYYLEGERLSELFQSYFSIPIPEGTQIKITVERSASGDSGSYSYDVNLLFMESYAAAQGERVIFALSNSCTVSDGPGTDRLIPLDDSQIPGGWGVYRYTPNEARTDGTIETLWSLPEESTVVDFWGIEDGREFSLLTQEEGQLRLRIFDEEVHLVQTLDLLPFSETETYMQVYKGNGFFVPITYGPRGERYCYRFAVVSRQTDGWSLAFTGDNWEATQLRHGSFSWAHDSRHGLDMAFDGQRLAIRDSEAYDSNPFYLAIYSKDGLEYLADYYNSASRAGNALYTAFSHSAVQTSWIEEQMVRWTETSS